MALQELVAGLTEAGTVRRVFGDPIEGDGALLIPPAGSLVGIAPVQASRQKLLNPR